MAEHLKEQVHRIGNRLQEILRPLDDKQYDKAVIAVNDTVSALLRLAAQISNYYVRLPDDGSVVVVPHGTRVVSADDVTVEIGPHEVRVVSGASVKPGQGKRNRRTA